jgi:DNA-binding response OmpR family regulator
VQGPGQWASTEVAQLLPYRCETEQEACVQQLQQAVLVAGRDTKECKQLCGMLQKANYAATAVHTLDHIECSTREKSPWVVILDLDTLPVDNRFIKQLFNHNPGICIIAISSRSFHPELKEAITTYFSACLRKPLDADELLYWLKSIRRVTDESDGD